MSMLLIRCVALLPLPLPGTSMNPPLDAGMGEAARRPLPPGVSSGASTRGDDSILMPSCSETRLEEGTEAGTSSLAPLLALACMTHGQSVQSDGGASQICRPIGALIRLCVDQITREERNSSRVIGLCAIALCEDRLKEWGAVHRRASDRRVTDSHSL